MPVEADLAFVVGQFRIPGRYLSAARYGSGHINDTYVATFEDKDRQVRYILQRLNTQVFADPAALMENVVRVVDHLGASNGSVPPLVRTLDDRAYFTSDGHGFWRTYVFIEGARTYDVVETPAQAREAARMFGRFQRQMADLPGPRLHETIVDFHDTELRFRQFLQALESNAADRARLCQDEISFAKSHVDLASALMRQIRRGTIPERVTHNDTKINNVMLDTGTGKGVCVIDLDTVMPGSVLFDFGDLVRTATSMAPEDEIDLSRGKFGGELFEAVVDGYADATRDWLCDAEKASLALSASVMTFEVGLRFLTDYLEGDNYFRTGYPDHNLVRCRAQFALVRDMETRSDEMESIVTDRFGPAAT